MSSQDKCRVDYCTEKLDYFTIQQEIRNLEGRVLTMIDGLFSDQRQNKAVKDLIRNDLSRTIDKIAMLATPKGDREQFII